jgi:hypothetical protein
VRLTVPIHSDNEDTVQPVANQRPTR